MKKGGEQNKMSDENKMIITSEVIDLSENIDDRYITLTNRLCYYDEPNLNKVVLPSENAEEKAKSLIDMPVVAKYRKNYLGQGDFAGHELTFDENGVPIWGTESIGVHKSVEIKKELVTTVDNKTKELPCLYATSMIWTRNKHIIDTIKSLYENGGLYTSWEINTLAYTYENGVKTLSDYEFTANCLLSHMATPAYGNTSKTFDISTLNNTELMIAEALEKDIISEQGVNMSKKEDITQIDKQDDNKEKIVDTSELTIEDVRRKIVQEVYKAHEDIWYVAHIFPMANYVLAKNEETEGDLTFVKINYTISDNGEISIDENEEIITLTISLSEVEDVLAKKDSAITEQATALVKANEVIDKLKTELSELKPIKEAYEKAEAEKKEKELSEKREILKNKVIKSKLFSEEEITPSENETSEVYDLIQKADENGINMLIGQRVMASLDNIQDCIETKKVETSEIKETKVTSVTDSLNDDVIDDGFSVSMLWK